jgi:hypothetical protein
MGDMKECFEPYKELHKQRVAKNPERLKYATQALDKNDIAYKVCNEQTAQINCYLASGKVITFYAGTGKIQGYYARGIHNLVKICKGQPVSNKI